MILQSDFIIIILGSCEVSRVQDETNYYANVSLLGRNSVAILYHEHVDGSLM